MYNRYWCFLGTYKITVGGNKMALSKKPVNGMKDILPQEMEI